LIVAGSEEGIVMVEAGAREVSEATMVEALAFGHEHIKQIVPLQRELAARLDVKTDRPAGALRVLGAYAEPRTDHGPLAERLGPHLVELARFVGAGEVRYGARGDLINALRAVSGASGG